MTERKAKVNDKERGFSAGMTDREGELEESGI